MTQAATHRFTVADYDRMVEAGVFNEDDRIELIDGEIIDMSPVGYHHAGIVKRIASLFRSLGPERAIISIQNPIVLDDESEPEPDICLLRPRKDFYTTRHPNADDVLLLIEVAETSGEYDRSRKIPVYAKAGIADVWLVDLASKLVECYRDPAGGQYESVTTHRKGETLTPLAFDDFNAPVDQMLL